MAETKIIHDLENVPKTEHFFSFFHSVEKVNLFLTMNIRACLSNMRILTRFSILI